MSDNTEPEDNEETGDNEAGGTFETSESAGNRESPDEVPEYEGQWAANSAPADEDEPQIVRSEDDDAEEKQLFRLK